LGTYYKPGKKPTAILLLGAQGLSQRRIKHARFWPLGITSEVIMQCDHCTNTGVAIDHG
jgi:hypothetical protein